MKSRVATVYINGRFLEQPLSGVQRYAREMIRALDRILAAENEVTEHWCLLTTGRRQERLDLERIDVRTLPRHVPGHLWEQVILARAAREGALVGFGGSGPMSHGRQLVVIHDAAVFRHPEFFSTVYGTWHRSLDRALAKRARIATVSEFSRAELADVLDLDPARIPVLYNGADHLERAGLAADVADRLELGQEPYFVVLGNLTKNKNVSTAIEASRSVPNCKLVIVGAQVRRIFGSAPATEGEGQVIFAGRLEDAEIVGLLQNASALIFPSLYEGFGIPPLEAMRIGCPVIAADIPAVREACGDAALYLDPSDPMQLARCMRTSLSQGSEERAERISRGMARAASFTWARSARELLAFCRSELLRNGSS